MWRWAFVGICLMASWSGASADSVADFYKSKVVTITVGYGPGGGYDLYARLVARHLGKHIPGAPQVIVQNMPGAGSLLAANYIYSSAPADGTAIAIAGRLTRLHARPVEKAGFRG